MLKKKKKKIFFNFLDMLVLQSFKLASEFLRKGGWFITKVFRSKDYYSLLWIFQQLFKKVDSTKPQASRNESAEIFVVCQNYLAPDHIDEKFFDISYVFSDASLDPSHAPLKTNLLQTLLKPKINQRHRDGYADNDYTLFHRLNASEFVKNNSFVELLAKSNQVWIIDSVDFVESFYNFLVVYRLYLMTIKLANMQRLLKKLKSV
jgi:AdoMet-dependent rRNA methyltransferase SPB1